MSQRGQTFKLPDGSWAYRYRNAPGRRPVRPQKGGYKTRSDARAALDDQLRRLQLGNAAHADQPLRDLVDEFLAQYDRAPATVAWMRYHLDRILAEFGDRPLGDLNAADIARWRLTQPPASRHQTIKAFRQVLRKGVAWKWIADNAAADVDAPAPRRAELEPFASWDEVYAISAELEPRDCALVIVAAGTGLRPEELFALERRDIDLEQRVVLVRRAWAKGHLKTYAKTDRSTRRVPLRARVGDELAFHLDEHVKPGPRALVFFDYEGKRIAIDNWRRRHWTPALDAAGLPVRGPYHLRHTYATWSLAAGVGIYTVARRMGTSVAMIDKTYGHLAVDADEYERDLLDRWDAS